MNCFHKLEQWLNLTQIIDERKLKNTKKGKFCRFLALQLWETRNYKFLVGFNCFSRSFISSITADV